MTDIFRGEHFSISPLQHSLSIHGQECSLRPKTFALMLYLVEHQGEVMTKERLLAQIWDDVHVDEQVLFQSIAEIRKIFGDIKVIQTFPRKGYSWVAFVKKESELGIDGTEFSEVAKAGSENQEGDVLKTDEAKNHHVPKGHRRRPSLASMFIIAILAMLAVPLSNYLLQVNDEEVSLPDKVATIQHIPSAAQGSVLVLPITNLVDGNDHRWVQLGGMDQLITQIGDKSRVMDTAYVLRTIHLSQDAGVEGNFGVRRMFETSGAGLIVETELSGSVKEYQLVYKLHFRNDVKRGVIFKPSVEESLYQLAGIVRKYAAIDNQEEKTPRNYHNEFHNEVVAQAFQEHGSGNLDSAVQLLEGFLALKPEAVYLRQLLGRWLLEQGSLAAAEITFIDAIKASQKVGDANVPGSLYFWLATAQQQQDKLGDSKASLALAKRSSMEQKDLLYQAFSAQLEGYILQEESSFSSAQRAFEQALNLHKAIYCPLGTAIVEMEMAELFIKQSKADFAQAHLQNAKQLIVNHRITSLESMLHDKQGMFFNFQQRVNAE